MPKNDDPGKFLFIMTRTARHWRMEIDDLLWHYGLTEARTRPLIYIDRLGDGIRQKDLAAELEIEGSSLVRLLDSLERAKLIRRKMGKDDRRERKLYLTEEGRSVVKLVRGMTDDLHKHVLSGVSAKDQRTCLQAFEILDKALLNAANIIDPRPAEDIAPPRNAFRKRAPAAKRSTPAAKRRPTG